MSAQDIIVVVGFFFFASFFAMAVVVVFPFAKLSYLRVYSRLCAVVRLFLPALL
jgi:hypothetical protein